MTLGEISVELILLYGFVVPNVMLLQVAAAVNIQYQKNEDIQYTYIKTCTPIEEHARTILTPYAFNALQNELVLSMQYEVTDTPDGSYHLRHYKGLDKALVICTEQIQCSCKSFEHSGIICRHCLRVLLVKNCFQLPEIYFLPRWRSDSNFYSVDVQNQQPGVDECCEVFHTLSATLLTESIMTRERFNYVHRELAGLIENVRNMPASNEFTVTSGPRSLVEL